MYCNTPLIVRSSTPHIRFIYFNQDIYLYIDVGKDYIGLSPSNITLNIGRVNKIFNRDQMISLFLQHILYH